MLFFSLAGNSSISKLDETTNFFKFLILIKYLFRLLYLPAGRQVVAFRKYSGRRIAGEEKCQINFTFFSVLDCLNTKSLKFLKVLLHSFDLFGGVPLPIHDFSSDPKRITGTV